MDCCLFSFWQSDYDDDVRGWTVAGAEMAKMAS